MNKMAGKNNLGWIVLFIIIALLILNSPALFPVGKSHIKTESDIQERTKFGFFDKEPTTKIIETPKMKCENAIEEYLEEQEAEEDFGLVSWQPCCYELEKTGERNCIDVEEWYS